MDLPEQPVPAIYLFTTPIRYGDGHHATGFFYRFNETTFLITSRHALDIQTANGEQLKSVRIYTRPNPENVTQTTYYDIEVADDEGNVYWHTHPEGESIDIAALPLEPPVTSDQIQVETFDRKKSKFVSGNLAFTSGSSHRGDMSEDARHIVISATNSVILGYPLYVFPSNFPVARNAIISTPYGEEFNNDPKFATDAVTHSGLSGSPVVYIEEGGMTHIKDIKNNTVENAIDLISTWEWKLIGVHSEKSDVTADLDLSSAYYATLIPDLLESID